MTDQIFHAAGADATDGLAPLSTSSLMPAGVRAARTHGRASATPLIAAHRELLDALAAGTTATLQLMHEQNDRASDEITTEYALTAGVHQHLVCRYPGRARLEFPTKRLTQNLVLNGRTLLPWLAVRWSGFRKGRIDIVVGTTPSMLVPLALIEAKIGVGRLAAVTDDLKRFCRLLRVLPVGKTPDLIGVSLFVSRREGVDADEIIDAVVVHLDALRLELDEFALGYHDLEFDLHELDGGSAHPSELEWIDEAPVPLGVLPGSATVPVAVTVRRRPPDRAG